MINPLYHIAVPEGVVVSNADCNLILQLDINALFYLVMKDDTLVELKYFRLETSDYDSYLLELETVLNESITAKDFRKTVVIFNWPDSSLVPARFYSADTNREIIELLHGDLKNGTILSEEVSGWNLHNIYRVPSEVYELIGERFANAENRHFGTPWLQTLKGSESGAKLVLLPGQMLILITRNDELLISQHFIYETDDDIYFYLLKLAKEFDLDPASIPLEVSGFILKESSLLETLRSWFPLMKLSSSNHPTGQFPSHFFSPILNLAKCVS